MDTNNFISYPAILLLQIMLVNAGVEISIVCEIGLVREKSYYVIMGAITNI